MTVVAAAAAKCRIINSVDVRSPYILGIEAHCGLLTIGQWHTAVKPASPDKKDRTGDIYRDKDSVNVQFVVVV